jgi:putative ABC transport system permease protein
MTAIGLIDSCRFSVQALHRQGFRSLMVILTVTIGVASVLALTALGEGARRYVINEFAFLGSDTLVVLPGKKETTGGLPPIMGTSARDLTLRDAEILQTRVTAISATAPIVIGSAEVSFQQRSREVLVLGSSSSFINIRQLSLAKGRNLRTGDIHTPGNECLIGETLKEALFGAQDPLGQWLRIGDFRLQVVGVIAGRGDAFGIDLSDAALIPVAISQQLYNVEGLFRLLLQLHPDSPTQRSKERIIEVIKELHHGHDDVTLVSPDAMLSTFDDILMVLTLAVAAIGAISLLVAGILIMNITLINISQRTREIGLLKALGANASVIQQFFIVESLLLSGLGTALGLLLGQLAVYGGLSVFPDVPFAIPAWAWLAAPSVTLLIGLLFAWLPSRRASQLPAVEAMQSP